MNRIFIAIISILPATILSFSFAIVIPAIYPDNSSVIIYYYSTFLFLFSVSTLSTNYIFTIRFPKLTILETRKEFSAILVFRIIGSFLIFFLVLIFSHNLLLSSYLGFWLVLKNIQEILINFYRAKSDQKNIFYKSSYFYLPDVFILIYSYVLRVDINYLFNILIFFNICTTLIQIYIDRSIFSRFQYKELPISNYIHNIIPLGLSNWRESIGVNGAVIAASYIFPLDYLPSINFFLRYYRVSAIISSSLSNFFFQDFIRNLHKINDLFIVSSIIVVIHFLQYFCINLNLFDGFINRVFIDKPSLILTLGLLLYTFASSFFGIIQIRMIINSKPLLLIYFEIIWIISMIFCFYLSNLFQWLFWYSQVIGFLISLIILFFINKKNLSV